MKRRMVMLCCVFGLSLLSACGQEGKKPHEETFTETFLLTEAEQGTDGVTVLEMTSASAADDAEKRELTKQEILFFEAYVNQMAHYGFLLSEYDSPAGVDLEQVFYSGAGMEMPELTEEECQAYLQATGQDEIYTDVTHLTTAQLDEFLQDTLGLSYADMEKPLSWVYVTEYDTYYHEAGDTNALTWDCMSGYVIGEKTYVLEFMAHEFYVPDCELMLEKSGESYHFISSVLHSR